MRQSGTIITSVPRPIIVPRWMPIALGELGVLEDTRPGKSNSRIEQYHGVTRGGVAVDDIPWCSSFVSWVLEMAGIPSTRSKTAASYATWGETGTWIFGDVILFPKTDPDAGGSGHVAFLLGKTTAGQCWVLGGNQTNAVTIATRYTKGAIVRRPVSIALPVA